jgi:hypothetical protein
MAFFDIFRKKPTPVVEPKLPEPKEPRARQSKEEPKTAKQQATENNLPYVNILSMDVDLDNLHQGAF